MLDDALSSDKDGHYGWFWQLKDVPEAPESRYLYTLLAGHDFQEGLKNYRDLTFMGKTLDHWGDNMEAFGDMIDTRERAYAERTPKVDALLASGAVDKLAQRRTDLETRVNTIEKDQDVCRSRLRRGARAVGAHPAVWRRRSRALRIRRRTPSCVSV